MLNAIHELSNISPPKFHKARMSICLQLLFSSYYIIRFYHGCYLHSFPCALSLFPFHLKQQCIAINCMILRSHSRLSLLHHTVWCLHCEKFFLTHVKFLIWLVTICLHGKSITISKPVLSKFCLI